MQPIFLTPLFYKPDRAADIDFSRKTHRPIFFEFLFEPFLCLIFWMPNSTAETSFPLSNRSLAKS